MAPFASVHPCLAIIPARGGSKGLPGKNIRPLMGLPLLTHSVHCARLARDLEAVIVSTDDPRIAEVAREAGAEVPFLRPEALAQDDTPTMPVLKHALEEMERRRGERFSTVLLLEPTSPGRLPEDIERAFELLAAAPEADGVVSVSEPPFNPFYVGVVEKDGYLTPAFPQPEGFTRRQQAPTFLRLNGALYLWRRDFIARAPAAWLQGRHRALIIPDERAFSIDNLFEFEMTELLLKHGRVRLPWLEQRR